jgi:hypothetical protein
VVLQRRQPKSEPLGLRLRPRVIGDVVVRRSAIGQAVTSRKLAASKRQGAGKRNGVQTFASSMRKRRLLRISRRQPAEQGAVVLREPGLLEECRSGCVQRSAERSSPQVFDQGDDGQPLRRNDIGE